MIGVAPHHEARSRMPTDPPADATPSLAEAWEQARAEALGRAREARRQALRSYALWYGLPALAAALAPFLLAALR